MINNTIKVFRREGKPFNSDVLENIPPIKKLAQTAEWLEGELLIPRTTISTYSIRPLLTQGLKANGGDAKVTRLKRLPVRREVIGIDSTSIPLAESRKGILLAARATLIRRTMRGYGVERIGPILAYITNETLAELRHELIASWRIIRLATVDPWYSKQIVMTILEKWLLWRAASTSSDAIILVDGSLRPSVIKLRNYTIQRIMAEAEDRGNTVIGVSKRSKLFRWCPEKLLKLVEERPPAVVEVPEAKRYLKNVLGTVFFTLFSRDGAPLRTDVPEYGGEPLQKLEELYSNDLFQSGYPETLRQAHVFSKLSRTERIGLRLNLRLFKARLLPSERNRDVLFGGFSRASGEWGVGDANLR